MCEQDIKELDMVFEISNVVAKELNVTLPEALEVSSKIVDKLRDLNG